MRQQERPRYGPLALALFAVAGIVTFVWIGVVIRWSPIEILPRGPRGMAICALVYLGPGLLVGTVAAALPKARRLKCFHYGWSERVR